MPSTSTEAPWPLLRRAARTVVVVDLVESVRLYELDEEGTVQRWQAFVREVVAEGLPKHGGRLVKSLGDGLMVECESVSSAIQCSRVMQQIIAKANRDQPRERWMCLRAAAHVGDVYLDQNDIQGRAVNIAARLCSIAQPGEFVVSADVHDQLAPGLDAELEDLGECHLKHMVSPVRAYRVVSPQSEPPQERMMPAQVQLRPSVAVVPLSTQGNDPRLPVLGEMLVDEVINSMSRASELQVISRLSTSPFRDRPDLLGDVRQHLRANYLAAGSCRLDGSQLRVHIELVEVATAHVLWAESFATPVEMALGTGAGLAETVSTRISVAILANELTQAHTKPLPNLGAYTMLLGGVMLLHRFSHSDFDRAREVLEALTQRVPRHATPWAWLARWHDLRVVQGWSDDPARDRALALDLSNKALDLDERSSIALTTAGAVHCSLMKDLDTGIGFYRKAIEFNASEPLAWLLLGAAHSFRGEGEAAVLASERAVQLSPVDPMRFLYDALSASAAIAAGQHDRAIELAQRSLRANRAHVSTYRVLAIAQSMNGQMDAARSTVQQLLTLDPHFSVERFLQRSPGANYEIGRRFADALSAAGLPSGTTSPL